MERLKDIQLFELNGTTVDVYQLTLVLLAILGVIAGNYLLLRRLLPWYYNRETISEQNRSRLQRVIRFSLYSLLGIAVLQIFDIDFTLIDLLIQREQTDDGPATFLTIHISTIVKAIITFTFARVLDTLIEEFLIQRYHRQQLKNDSAAAVTTVDEAVVNRFQAVRPVMYTFATLLVLRDMGLSRLVLYGFREMREMADASTREVVTGTITVGNVVFAIGVFFLIRLSLLLLTSLVLGTYYRRSNVDRGSQYAINRLLTYFVYLIGVLLTLQAAGFNLVVLWTGAAALLVGIGIGLQQTFNDLICGVIILFERSVMVGDVVEIEGHQVGTVRKIGARTSTVETRDDIIIFVPNSKLIGENVVNWSHVQRQARFHVKVGVAYGSDTDLVRKTLMEVADGHPRIMKSPKPNVRFLDFGESSLDFDLLFWSRDFMRIEDVMSDVRFAIDKAFREKGIEIPFPQRDVWFRGGAAGNP